jgi:hypothetical protein
MVDMPARKAHVLSSARELAATIGGVIPPSSQVRTAAGNTVRGFDYARTTARSPRKLDHGPTL